jgi:hypothetical protein
VGCKAGLFLLTVSFYKTGGLQMNMAYDRDQNQDANPEDVRGGKEKINRQQRRPAYKAPGRAPSAFNGMHRRRNKRFSW